MKIVDSPRPVSKSEQYRQAAREIVGQNKAAFFEKENESIDFYKAAKSIGYCALRRKQKSGGWLVWVLTPTISHD